SVAAGSGAIGLTTANANINLTSNGSAVGAVVKSSTNSTAAFQVQGSSATVLNVDTTTNKLTVTSSGAAAVVGSELITTTDFTNATWTKTGWTATTTTAAHTTGNTNALSTSQFAAVSGAIYQVTFTVTGSPTAGETVTPYIGVNTSTGSSPVSGNGTFVEVLSQSGTLTPALQFVPT